MVSNTTIRASSWSLLKTFIDTYVTTNSGIVKASFNPKIDTFPQYIIPQVSIDSNPLTLNVLRRDQTMTFNVSIYSKDNATLDSAADEFYDALITNAGSYFEPEGLYLTEVTDNDPEADEIGGQIVYSKVLGVTFERVENRN